MITLKKKPKNPIIIEGFPGFGLIGTISTEFLLETLKFEKIGKIRFDDIPAMVAIHGGKVIEPLGIFYNQKNNLILIHAITSSAGMEWKISEAIVDIAKQLKAKEIISIEGVGTTREGGNEVFYYTNSAKSKKKFHDMKIKPLNEGIIMGVTGTLLLEAENISNSCLFAETHSSMPDSKAASKIIETLNKYLNLNIDTKPLLKQAEKFEDKIKGLMKQGQEASEQQLRKKLSYVG